MNVENKPTFIPNVMCRLCLKQCEDENSVEISYTNDLSIKIMACVGLEVTQQDTLPKRICDECHLSLEKLFLFKNKCKNSDSKLRRHYRLINAGKRSRVFDDSDDEFEDDYTESITLINNLESKINNLKSVPKYKNSGSEIRDVLDESESPKDDLQNIVLKNKKSPTIVAEGSTSLNRTRFSTRLQNIDKNKKMDMNYSYDPNGSIEVLFEEMDNEQELEFILPEPVDHIPDDQIYYSDSNDAITEFIFEDDDSKPQDSLTSQNATKSEEFDISEESMDENLGDETDDYNASLLESLLPTIKTSIADKSGTYLDDKAQYKLIRRTGNEIKVQCIASDGKEFEIEMVQQSNVERDESGDLKIFKCSKCPKTFSRRGKLMNHERDHGVKSNGQECPYCQKFFPSNSTLTRHIRVHTGEKPFKCNICNRSFIQKEILKRHLMTHSGERPFKCLHCAKSFILKEALRQHVNRNHTENPTPEMHNCPLCIKSFCHSSGLSRHLLIHAGRTFACEYCHKKFNDKSALKRHTASIHYANQKKLN